MHGDRVYTYGATGIAHCLEGPTGEVVWSRRFDASTGFEPAKWVARLRATATGDAPLLLKTEMNAGHGGVSGRYAAWRERAWELAWIIDTATRGIE